ncbi:unnamed protein product, partial [Polarella glacialis]
AGAAPTASSSSGSSFKALRAKLNSLNYFQPLSEESLALAEKLLEDILRSAENLRGLEKSALSRERESKERVAELKSLRWENPRLLKENTELHRRVLDDSCGHRNQRKQWADRITAADGEIAHVQLLQQLGVSRGAEMRRSAELLRSQVSEMRRLDAGVADNSGSRPRPSSITIRGQAPPRLPEADDGSRRAQ